MKLLSARFVGTYVIVSSLFVAAVSGEPSILVAVLLGCVLGWFVLKRNMLARRIVMVLSALAATMLLAVLVFGLIHGTEGVNFSLGFLLDVTNPSLSVHVLLGSAFTCWFGLPFLVLRLNRVRKEFEERVSRTTGSTVRV